MTNESIPIASSKAGISAPQGTASRTRVLLHGPIVLTLLRLGPPNGKTDKVTAKQQHPVAEGIVGELRFILDPKSLAWQRD